jgi:hypothetical protein
MSRADCSSPGRACVVAAGDYAITAVIHRCQAVRDTIYGLLVVVLLPAIVATRFTRIIDKILVTSCTPLRDLSYY